MANNPTLLTQPIAANGAKNAIPNTTSTVGAMSQDQGFPAETALPLGAGGVAPSREDFNGAFNLLSGIAFMAQKGWVFLFDENQNYFAGCMVRDPIDSKIYEAINDVPASSTPPSADSVNWKAAAVDISNKANITLNNLDTANLVCHVVVDSYYDSTTGDWWREYDDGWVEQGGRRNYTTGGDTTATVNLHKPFADTNYTVFKTFGINQATRPYTGVIALHYYTVYALTTTSFKTDYNTGNTGMGDFAWYACGMGASV
jgi:hypothetical protein